MANLKFNPSYSHAQIIFDSGKESLYFELTNGDLFNAIVDCFNKNKISESDFQKLKEEVFEKSVIHFLENGLVFKIGFLENKIEKFSDVMFTVCDCTEKGVHGHIRNEEGLTIGLVGYGITFYEKEPALHLADCLYEQGVITENNHGSLKTAIYDSELPISLLNN